MPPFDVISRRCTLEIVLSIKNIFIKILASKVTNWIIVDIHKHILLSLANSKQHIFIRNGDCQRSQDSEDKGGLGWTTKYKE